MIELRKPVENMTDCDKIVRAFQNLETENIYVNAMPKSDGSIRAATNVSTVHVISKQYSFSLYFTTKKMRIQEFPYGIIPTRYFDINDVAGADVLKDKVTFYLTDGKKYNLSTNNFTIDFADMTKSTPEIVSPAGVERATPLVVNVA